MLSLKLSIHSKVSGSLVKISKDQIKNTIQTKPELNSLNIHSSTKDNNVEKISSLEDLIKLSSKKKEIELKYDLEKNVNLIKFSDGKIEGRYQDENGIFYHFSK